MNKLVNMFLGAALVLGCACGGGVQAVNGNETLSDTARVVTLLGPDSFRAQMAARPGIILDVRTPGEYRKGFIEGAMLLDIFNDSFEMKLDALDRNQTYYVYCAMGGRSAEAAEKMEKAGFRAVFDLDGGYTAWKKAGY